MQDLIKYYNIPKVHQNFIDLPWFENSIIRIAGFGLLCLIVLLSILSLIF